MPRLISKSLVLPLLYLCLFQTSSANHCTVSKIALLPSETADSPSGFFTLQTQDANSEACHVSQTLRFSIESDNGGSVTSSTGNALSYFVSSGSANRNFLYTSGNSEAYKLTAKAGYGTASDWTASFSAFYSSSVDANEENRNEGSTGQGYTLTSAQASNSTHYSASTLTNKKPEAGISVSAGRDRVGSVGSPLEFKAEISLPSHKTNDLRWNFGDGSEGAGQVITHTYDYPGEYIVVLNLNTPGGRAVTRSNVTITDPQLSITRADINRIEIRNGSKVEVNLYGRALESHGNIFAFPQDTLLKAGQSISFISKVTNLKPESVDDVILLTIGQTEQPQMRAKVEEEKKARVVAVMTELESLQAQLANMQVTQAQPIKKVASATVLPGKVETSLETEILPSSQTALVSETLSLVEENPEQGWISKLKRFFLRTKNE